MPPGETRSAAVGPNRRRPMAGPATGRPAKWALRPWPTPALVRADEARRRRCRASGREQALGPARFGGHAGAGDEAHQVCDGDVERVPRRHVELGRAASEMARSRWCLTPDAVALTSMPAPASASARSRFATASATRLRQEAEERLSRVVGRREAAGLVDEPLEMAEDDRLEQCFFGGEMAVDRADADAGLLRRCRRSAPRGPRSRRPPRRPRALLRGCAVRLPAGSGGSPGRLCSRRARRPPQHPARVGDRPLDQRASPRATTRARVDNRNQGSV